MAPHKADMLSFNSVRHSQSRDEASRPLRDTSALVIFSSLPHRSFQLLIICLQTSSSSSRMRGFPWAPTATCTSLTPYRKTAARTTAATLLSPNYAPSSRRSPCLSQSGAVGLQNTKHAFTKNMARRDAVTPC